MSSSAPTPPGPNLGIGEAAMPHFQAVRQNPYLHFTLSELQGAMASISVYVFFHLVSYAIQSMGQKYPLHFTEPAETFGHILEWGAVYGGSGSFIIITIFGILRLIKTLWSQLSA